MLVFQFSLYISGTANIIATSIFQIKHYQQLNGSCLKKRFQFLLNQYWPDIDIQIQ